MQARLSDKADELVTLLQASPDAVVAVDAKGRVVLASAAVRALFGLEPDEILGQALETLLPERVRQGHEAHRFSFGEVEVPRPMGLGLRLNGKHKDGHEFPVDVSLAPFVLKGEKMVAAFVRDITDRSRQEASLRAINEISQRLLEGEATQATLELVARRARGLVDATLAWVVVPVGQHGLVVSASAGDGAQSIIGAEATAGTSLPGKAMEQGTSILVADMSREPDVSPSIRDLELGPALCCPLSTEDRVLGALLVARPRGAQVFGPRDTEVVEVFANAAMVALTLGENRVKLEELQVTAEHERIGRDLHDTVIQRLFALGMGLQGVEGLVTDTIAGKISEVVDGLDEVIRDIRETIFCLERPAMAEMGLRQAVNGVVKTAAGQLGFTPRVGFHGPVDAVTSAQLEAHIVAVLTEGLSNVARHARATLAEVVVAVEQNTIVVSVADDGLGPPKGPSAGNGLRNLAERARLCSGTASITQRSPSGTVLEWRAPLNL